MLYAALLMIASVALTIVGVTALGHGQGEIPALALAIPALWILPQPLALSISLFMILPILAVSFSSKSPWQLGAMLIAVVIAMLFGLMALQTESKLSGSMGATCMQLMGVLMIWYAARSWRPVTGNTWWALGFATLVLAPQFEVPSPILVSWLLILGGGLLGEFLLEENEEEEV